jgi:hypothetical protein
MPCLRHSRTGCKEGIHSEYVYANPKFQFIPLYALEEKANFVAKGISKTILNPYLKLGAIQRTTSKFFLCVIRVLLGL